MIGIYLVKITLKKALWQLKLEGHVKISKVFSIKVLLRGSKMGVQGVGH